jgi:hypothetical protein
MKHFACIQYKKNIFISFFFLSSFFIISCNKIEKTDIGSELIPGTDKLITDTLSFSIETQLLPFEGINLDSAVIQKNEVHCIGSINDPAFGSTVASAFIQPLPAAYPFKFPVSKDSLSLDSLVLSITYAGTYGDTNNISKVNVYEITDPEFNGNKNYKLYEAPKFSDEVIGSASFTKLQLTTPSNLSYKGETSINQLRIRLNDALGNSLLSQDNITGAYQNDSTFINFLRGFAVIPEVNTNQRGALHYFAFIAPTTRLLLYYKAIKSDGKIDTSVASYPFTAELNRSANANKIIRTPSTTITNDPQYAYVMAAPGISTNIEIKGLDSIRGNPYIIHRAEILATQADDNSFSDIFYPPVTHLYSINDNGEQSPIPFDSVFYFNRVSLDSRRNLFLNSISIEYCGGNPIYKTINNKRLAEYRYNVTRYVQNYINGNTINKKFRISAPYYAEFAGGNISLTPLNVIAAGRVKLNGGAHPTKPMRLLIYYSKP